MFIILEQLQIDQQIENLYYQLNQYLEEQQLPIQHLAYLDIDEIELSDKLINFKNELEDIINTYRYLGIQASDIGPYNLGYSKTGKLKAFDIDDKVR